MSGDSIEVTVVMTSRGSGQARDQAPREISVYRLSLRGDPEENLAAARPETDLPAIDLFKGFEEESDLRRTTQIEQMPNHRVSDLLGSHLSKTRRNPSPRGEDFDGDDRMGSAVVFRISEALSC
jgi:hypothetical protein